jgi:hypothetical protein
MVNTYQMKLELNKQITQAKKEAAHKKKQLQQITKLCKKLSKQRALADDYANQLMELEKNM